MCEINSVKDTVHFTDKMDLEKVHNCTYTCTKSSPGSLIISDFGEVYKAVTCC